MNEEARTLYEALRVGLRHEALPPKTLEDMKARRLVEDRGSLGRVWFLTPKGEKKLNGG